MTRDVLVQNLIGYWDKIPIFLFVSRYVYQYFSETRRVKKYNYRVCSGTHVKFMPIKSFYREIIVLFASFFLSIDWWWPSKTYVRTYLYYYKLKPITHILRLWIRIILKLRFIRRSSSIKFVCTQICTYVPISIFLRNKESKTKYNYHSSHIVNT